MAEANYDSSKVNEETSEALFENTRPFGLEIVASLVEFAFVVVDERRSSAFKTERRTHSTTGDREACSSQRTSRDATSTSNSDTCEEVLTEQLVFVFICLCVVLLD
jgi:hypothetical protein